MSNKATYILTKVTDDSVTSEELSDGDMGKIRVSLAKRRTRFAVNGALFRQYSKLISKIHSLEY